MELWWVVGQKHPIKDIENTNCQSPSLPLSNDVLPSCVFDAMTESHRGPMLSGSGRGRGSFLSVFINPKDPDAVELGQLGNQHGE